MISIEKSSLVEGAKTRAVLVKILTAMSEIIDEDNSVRFRSGRINMIAVFSRFTQSELVLLALCLGVPGDVSTEVLPDERR